jgi:uncharacterized membrane protein
MEFVIILIGVVLSILVFNLRGRVQKLEQLMQDRTLLRAPGSSHTSQQKQPELQQQKTLAPAREYIAQQLAQNVSREEIKNSLLTTGWQESDIENAFGSLQLSEQLRRPSITPVDTRPNPFEQLTVWAKEDWMLKLGALLLLIGFGWLTTYAFLNNWIGPMGRIALGVIVGALFIVLGWWRINKYINQGGIFLVLGSTTVLLTIFAARAIYGFFTPYSALIVMFLSTAFVALASVKYRSRSLALLSLLLASAAPLLTKAPSTDHVGLFAYLCVVMLGAMWIVFLTGQRELTTASLVVISLYSAPHLFSPSLFPLVDISTLLLFAYAFTVLFFLTNTAGILKPKSDTVAPDLITAAGSGMFLLAWVMVAAQAEWRSLILSAWMIVFAVGAFLIFRITQRREPLYVYSGVGIALLGAATSAELSGATLTTAYTLEAGSIALIAYLVFRNIRIAQRISLLLMVPVLLSIQSILSSAWATGVFHKDFFTLLVLGFTLLGLGLFFLPLTRNTEEKEIRQLNSILLTLGSAYLFVLLWLSLHAGLTNDNTAVMISLVIYTIVGLVSYFYGLIGEKKGLRLYGGVLIGLVVARLLLVDVWKMEMAGRIVTFFLIGALLVSTAFLGRKKKGY